MSKGVLVINAGSSSIKFRIFAMQEGKQSLVRVCKGGLEKLRSEAPHFRAVDETGAVLADTHLAGSGQTDRHRQGLSHLLDWIDGRRDLPDIAAVGHRVVHGGRRHLMPERVTPGLLADLQELIPLAPLHQPHNLAGIRAIAEIHPQLPQVACFDTAFHRTQPEIARRFALPREYGEAGIQRYGFHGLSYEFIAGVLPDYLGEQAGGRVVVAHLGSGASLCAIHNSQSVATTMGFTALEGLPMGTRSGTLDPGVLLYLMKERGMGYQELTDLLYNRSGLLGVSGISNDMRELLASPDPAARQAVDLFVYRIGRELGSLAAALGGLDALVFTAGIGENSPVIRSRVCELGRWLGIACDERRNEAAGPKISTDESLVSVWVIPTNEELVIARHTCRIALWR